MGNEDEDEVHARRREWSMRIHDEERCGIIVI